MIRAAGAFYCDGGTEMPNRGRALRLTVLLTRYRLDLIPPPSSWPRACHFASSSSFARFAEMISTPGSAACNLATSSS